MMNPYLRAATASPSLRANLKAQVATAKAKRAKGKAPVKPAKP